MVLLRRVVQTFQRVFGPPGRGNASNGLLLWTPVSLHNLPPRHSLGRLAD